MDFFWVALISLSSAIGYATYIRRKKSKPKSEAIVVIRDWKNPAPNDVLSVDGNDFIIEEVTRVEEGMRSWHECLLSGDDKFSWVSLNRDYAIFGQGIDFEALGGKISSSFDFQNDIYQLEKEGQALVKSSTSQIDESPETKKQLAQYLNYWDYFGLGDKRLCLRRFEEGAIEGYVGHRYLVHQFEFLQGS